MGILEDVATEEYFTPPEKPKVVPVSKEDAINICKMGQGADCCIWLVMGQEGFECLYYDKDAGRTLLGETLRERWHKGLTVAKRDGCDKMRAS